MEGQDTDKEKKSTRGVCPKGTRYGGRTKGTPNKVSGELRKRIASFLEERWDEAVNEWENIKEPKDKVKLYIELMAYVMPKLRSSDIDSIEDFLQAEKILQGLDDNSPSVVG